MPSPHPLPVLLLGLALFATACQGPLRAADLPPDDAQALVAAQYEQGYTDGTFFNAGVRQGTTLGDTGGLDGDAWRLGFTDALNGYPRREPPQLRQWLDRQP
ncbi:MAG: hypothetical protein AAGI68_13490 [Planctomycetota bacterium]